MIGDIIKGVLFATFWAIVAFLIAMFVLVPIAKMLGF